MPEQAATTAAPISVSPIFIDADNSSLGFGGGTKVGVSWNTNSSNKLILGPDTDCDGNMSEGETVYTNCSELDASWTPQWASLVSYWKMNNDAWVDSKGAFNGTPNNAPTFTTNSKVGSHAGSLNGAQYIGASGASLTGAAGTILLWVKSSSFDSVFNSHSGVWNQITLQNSATVLTFRLCGGVACTDLTTPVTRVTDNQWHQLAVTWTNGGSRNLYIDGNLVDTEAGTALFTPGVDFEIGFCSWGCGYFTGSMDEVAVWSTSLTDAEVQTLYSRQSAKYSGSLTSRVMNYGSSNAWSGIKWLTTLPFGKELTGDANNTGTITADDSETSADYTALVGSTGSTSDNNLMSGLIGLWHLNESSATGGASNDFIDSSGNNNHGELNGGVTFGLLGKIEKAPAFDGSSGKIDLVSAVTIPATASIAAWVKTTGVAQQAFFSNRSGGQTFFGTTGIGTVFHYDVNASDNQPATGLIAVNDGAWHHVVWTSDGVTSKFYVDGVFDGPATAQNRPASTGLAAIGAEAGGGGSWTLGQIDELSIWSRTLHPDEIKQLYRRGANRIKYQVRTCTISDCSDNPTWLGNDNSNGSYFSELHNFAPYNYDVNNCAVANLILTGSPSLFFDCFTGALSNLTSQPYFQYRAILESDDASTNCNYGSGATWCSPELSSVEVKP